MFTFSHPVRPAARLLAAVLAALVLGGCATGVPLYGSPTVTLAYEGATRTPADVATVVGDGATYFLTVNKSPLSAFRTLEGTSEVNGLPQVDLMPGLHSLGFCYRQVMAQMDYIPPSMPGWTYIPRATSPYRTIEMSCPFPVVVQQDFQAGRVYRASMKTGMVDRTSWTVELSDVTAELGDSVRKSREGLSGPRPPRMSAEKRIGQ